MDEGLQIVLIGHFYILVRRIDPLDRQFQRFPTTYGAHGGSGGVDFLCFHTGKRKQRVFFFLFKKPKFDITTPPV